MKEEKKVSKKRILGIPATLLVAGGLMFGAAQPAHAETTSTGLDSSCAADWVVGSIASGALTGAAGGPVGSVASATVGAAFGATGAIIRC